MSVLAVVSKAVFEAEARVDGKLVGPGDVWPTALYASQNPGLESLASGGALFLATVRPGDQLWLVGVLEAPKKGRKGWSASPNAAPVRDITALMPELRFSTGKGVATAPGRLGMSLQTPRQLTDGDEALLRGGSVATETKRDAAPAWKLDGYRRRKLTTRLTEKERALLGSMMGLLEANDEDEAGIELADVVDAASGDVVALLALWPIEAGILVDAATGEALADIYELVFDAHGDAALRERMKAALDASKIHFDDPPRDFTGKRDTPRQAAAAPPMPVGDDPAVLAAIAALHAELDATKGSKRDVHEVMNRISALRDAVLPRGLRPYPVIRPFELTRAQRAWLELVLDHYEWRLDLAHEGLPWKGAMQEENAPGATSPMARMVGRKPPLALDTTVELEGEPHPLWAIFKDVIVGLRPESAFDAAIAGQPLAVREGAWRQLASQQDRLGGIHPRNDKELQRGWAGPEDQDAANERYLRMLRALFDGLGDRGEAVALAALAEPVPKSQYERGQSTPLRIAALDGLARRAKAAGGVLDPEWDAAIGELASSGTGYRTWLLGLFALLPPERAGELTGVSYFLLQAFPSESGMLRLVAELARTDPSAKSDYVKLAARLAAKFPEAALPAMKAARRALKRFPDSLDKAIEAAEKALAKSGAKKGKPGKK